MPKLVDVLRNKIAQKGTHDVCLRFNQVDKLMTCSACEFVKELRIIESVEDTNICPNCGQQMHPNFVFFLPEWFDEDDYIILVSISDNLIDLIQYERNR